MPHPDAEHSLRIQLATALRERDAARTDAANLRFVNDKAREAYAAAYIRAEAADSHGNELLRRAVNAEKSLANANAEVTHLAALRTKQDAELVSAREALAAARQECEGLREVVAAGVGTHGEPCSKGEDCQFMRDARAALATGGEGK